MTKTTKIDTFFIAWIASIFDIAGLLVWWFIFLFAQSSHRSSSSFPIFLSVGNSFKTRWKRAMIYPSQCRMRRSRSMRSSSCKRPRTCASVSWTIRRVESSSLRRAQHSGTRSFLFSNPFTSMTTSLFFGVTYDPVVRRVESGRKSAAWKGRSLEKEA